MGAKSDSAVNTGSVRLGNGQAGVFIRADHAEASYLPALRLAIGIVRKTPIDTDLDAMIRDRVLSRLGDLAALLESCGGPGG